MFRTFGERLGRLGILAVGIALTVTWTFTYFLLYVAALFTWEGL